MNNVTELPCIFCGDTAALAMFHGSDDPRPVCAPHADYIEYLGADVGWQPLRRLPKIQAVRFAEDWVAMLESGDAA